MSKLLIQTNNILSSLEKDYSLDYSQLSKKFSSPTQQILNVDVGDIYIKKANNSEDLAKSIVQNLPNTVAQMLSKR